MVLKKVRACGSKGADLLAIPTISDTQPRAASAAVPMVKALLPVAPVLTAEVETDVDCKVPEEVQSLCSVISPGGLLEDTGVDIQV